MTFSERMGLAKATLQLDSMTTELRMVSGMHSARTSGRGVVIAFTPPMRLQMEFGARSLKM
jgi:hypothetical protein